jgi:phage RecT family recombinase
MSTNVNQKMNIVQKIEQSSPAQLATIPEVADRFKNIYTVMNGGDEARAAVKYEAEKFHFMKLIQDKPDLQACTKLSLYGCFLDMAVNGLSFDPSMKHAYVVSFNTNVGGRDNPKWEKRATLMISGYGELQMRTRQGQIKYADNPVLVYEGDVFLHGTKNDKPFLDHVAAFPRKTDNIIACYIRLERPDGSVDYKVLSIEEVMKLKKFSKDPNSKAWTDGLPGMVQAKTIKHAFRSYPKIRMGEFSTLQSKMIDEDVDAAPKIDYGLNGSMPTAAHPEEFPQGPGNYQPTMIVEAAQPVEHHNDDSFASKPQVGTGKVHEDDNF